MAKVIIIPNLTNSDVLFDMRKKSLSNEQQLGNIIEQKSILKMN